MKLIINEPLSSLEIWGVRYKDSPHWQRDFFSLELAEQFLKEVGVESSDIIPQVLPNGYYTPIPGTVIMIDTRESLFAGAVGETLYYTNKDNMKAVQQAVQQRADEEAQSIRIGG